MTLRSGWLAVLAVLLPTAIFVSVFFAIEASADQRAAREKAILGAEQIMRDIDEEIGRSAISLKILATASSLEKGDWQAARGRSIQIAEVNPDWRSVYLVDLTTKRLLFSTTRGVELEVPQPLRQRLVSSRVVFDGISRRAGHCTCILFGQRLSGSMSNLALIVEMEPTKFQNLLLHKTPRGAVSAVVDRDGNFIGRSVSFSERVGTPATAYVRNALRAGHSGFYRGRTYEGLENYTAFTTSDLTGWSSHMAVSSELISGPQRQRSIAIVIATAISVIFASLLVLFLSRAQARQKEAEARLLEAQRMESLGRLSGGIAHDFNNMLAIIGGGIELALRRIPDDPSLRRYLEAAGEGVRRANDLTRRMLAYARRQRLKPTVLNPKVLIEELAGLLERTLGDDIIVKWSAGDDTWLIEADRSELENALLNLATNAKDAMPAGGTLRIVARNAPAIEGVKGRSADCLEICVIDTGEGIPASQIARVTEPFYSTKPPGRGTGLGLSQVAGFVRQSGGDIEVFSELGRGTTICLALPRFEGPTPPDRCGSEPIDMTGGPSLSILLVEDDDGVRDTTISGLEELGHKVMAFAEPATALPMLDTASVDLVITDFQMPGMNGRELAERARKMRPGLPVLIISAYRTESVASEAFELLEKPFSLDQLAEAIHQSTNPNRQREGR